MFFQWQEIDMNAEIKEALDAARDYASFAMQHLLKHLHQNAYPFEKTMAELEAAFLYPSFNPIERVLITKLLFAQHEQSEREEVLKWMTTAGMMEKMTPLQKEIAKSFLRSPPPSWWRRCSNLGGDPIRGRPLHRLD